VVNSDHPFNDHQASLAPALVLITMCNSTNSLIMECPILVINNNRIHKIMDNPTLLDIRNTLLGMQLTHPNMYRDIHHRVQQHQLDQVSYLEHH
jgi:hypothetical protein